MAFLWLLGMALTALLHVEIAATRGHEDAALARENAKLALYMALGQLQQHAGRDDRITALADLLPDTHPDNRYWTGVWMAGESGERLVWLVSGGNPDSALSYRGVEGTVCLVGSASVQDAADEVHVAIEQVGDRGAIAYWVGDEGVKVSLSPVTSFPAGKPGWADTLAPPERARMVRIVPDKTGVETLLHRQGLINGSAFSLSERPPVTIADLFFMPGFTGSSVAGLFHLVSPESLGVLSRSDGRAGLRHDLSLDPGFLGDDFRAYSDYKDYLWEPGPETFLTQDGRDLRRIHRLVAPSTLDSVPGSIVHSVHPVLTDFGLQFAVKPEASGGMAAVLASQMVVELWNPYTSALAFEELELEIHGLETVQVDFYAKENPDTLLKSVPVDLSSLLGDPYRVKLSKRQYRPTSLYAEDSIDAKLFGAGRLLYWTGPGQATGTQTDQGYANYGDNSSSNTRWEQALGFNLPGEPHSLFMGYRMPETALLIRLVRSGTGEVLCEYRDFVFESIDTDPMTRLVSEWALNGFFGFQFRLLESGHTFTEDPSHWLKHFDPRNSVPTFAVGEPAHYVPNEKIMGASPDACNQNLKLRQNVGLEDRFLLDKPLSNGKVSVGADRNPMLFELPRQPLLSLGQLQHLQVSGYPPYAYGNPWGGSLNRIFDTAFFSGLTSEMIDHWNPTSGSPPHPRLRAVRAEDGSLPAAQAIGDTGAYSAFYWMVDGVFNINSTSVDAWESLLSSLRLRDFRYLAYDPDWTDDIHVDGEGMILDEAASNHYPPVFVRFPQSMQEHFAHAHDPMMYSGKLGSAPDHFHFFRTGFRFLAERTGIENDARAWKSDSSLPRDLAENIVKKLKARGRPFTSLESFLASNSGEGGEKSLLEEVLVETANGELLNSYLANANGGIRIVKPYERSPAYCSQADMLTALAPVMAVRSDTFVIRFYGDTRDPLNGTVRARAYGEARVQRLPLPVGEQGEQAWEDWIQADTPWGRQFKVVSFRWLEAGEI